MHHYTQIAQYTTYKVFILLIWETEEDAMEEKGIPERYSEMHNLGRMLQRI